MTQKITGAKGGGGGGTFVTKPDTLRSDDSFEILLGLGSGRWKGFVDGLESLKINGVPLENPDGTSNFQDVFVIFADGNPLETQIVNFHLGGGGNSQTVSTQLANANASGPGGWVTGSVSTPNANFIDLRFVAQQLFYQDKKSIREATATIDIEMRPSGSATWINIFSTPTSDAITYDKNGYNYVEDDGGFSSLIYLSRNMFNPSGTGFAASGYGLTISGKTTSPFVKELRIAVPNQGAYANKTWEVRARLVEKDTVDNDDIQERRSILFETITAIITEPLGDDPEWEGLVWAQIHGKASDQFNGFPEITSICDTKICQVPPPAVFDPDTRAYTQVTWDGSFVEKFTTDPAWQIKEFVEDPIHGVAGIYPGSTVDKWDALEASKYYSELVPDGQGGTHPRFNMNITINESKDINEMMQYLSGAVNSYAEDVGNGVWRLKVDKPETPVMLFTEDNIFGEFQYSHSDVDTRFNDWRGTFLDENLDYEVNTVRVFDQADIDTNGLKFTEVALIGCTNAQEALRRLMFRLRVSLNEFRAVNFETNRLGRLISPLDTILVADGALNPDHLIKSTSRLDSHSGTTVELKRELRLENDVVYKIKFATVADGVVERTITNTNAQRGDVTTIYIDSALPAGIMEDSAIALEATGLSALPVAYRVLSIERAENQEDSYLVTAMQIDSGKWSAMDNVSADAILAQESNITIDPPGVPAGGLFSVVEYYTDAQLKRVLQVNWDRPSGSFFEGYRVEYRLNNGPWVLVNEKQSDSIFELQTPEDGDYTFKIIALDRRGVQSNPLIDTFTIDSNTQVTPPAHGRGDLLDRPIDGPYDGFRFTATDGTVPITYVWDETGNNWVGEANLVTQGSDIGVENGATVGATPAQVAQLITLDSEITTAQSDIDDLVTTYGSTANAAQSAAEALASANDAFDDAGIANAAKLASETARDASVVARDASVAAQGASEAAAGQSQNSATASANSETISTAASQTATSKALLAASYSKTVEMSPNGRLTEGATDFYISQGLAFYGSPPFADSSPNGTWLSSYNGKAGVLEAKAGTGFDVLGKAVPIDTSRKYAISIEYMADGGSTIWYAGFAAFDINGNFLVSNPGTYGYCTLAAVNPPAGIWFKATNTTPVTGEGTGTATIFPVGTAFIAPVVLMNYNYAAGKTYISELYVSDVTQKEAAKNSAAAAVISENSATASAGVATTKAGEAAASAVTAGDAVTDSTAQATIASDKATEATTAASTATTQASLSATYSTNSLKNAGTGPVLPSDFALEGAHWVIGNNWDLAPYATPGNQLYAATYPINAEGKCLLVDAYQPSYVDIATQGVIVPKAGATYRYTLRIGSAVTAPEAFFLGLDANYLYVSASGYAVPLVGSFTSYTYDISGDYMIAQGWKNVRPMVRIASGAYAYVQSISMVDITERVAAGNSASAALASQNSATASAGTATTKASEAAGSASTANTAAGTATSAAGAASDSQTAAGISASSATTQASLSASYSTEASNSLAHTFPRTAVRAGFLEGNDHTTFNSATEILSAFNGAGTAFQINTSVGGQYQYGMWPKKTVPRVSNEVWRTTIKIAFTVGPVATYVLGHWISFDAAGAYISTGNYGSTQALTGGSIVDTRTFDLDMNIFGANVAYVRMGVLFNRDGGMNPQSGNVVEVHALYPENVTGVLASASSASAALVSQNSATASAGTATTKASEAASSASTANDAAGTATSQAGVASGHATTASTAASTATTQAGLSASYSTDNRLRTASTLPFDFQNDGAYWFSSYSGDPASRTPIVSGGGYTFTTVAGIGRVINVVNAGSYDIGAIGALAMQPGRTYKITARHRTLAGTRGVEIWAIGLGTDYIYSGGGSVNGYTSTTAWQSSSFQVTSDLLIGQGSSYIRPMFRVAEGSVEQQLAVLRLEDITDSLAAQTSATASLNSANSATASAGTATTKASEAATSASTASTAAGTATSEAGIAFTQATNASGSASTAATQAGLSATYRTEADTARLAAQQAMADNYPRKATIEAYVNSNNRTATSTTGNIVTGMNPNGTAVRLNNASSYPSGIWCKSVSAWQPNKKYQINLTVNQYAGSTYSNAVGWVTFMDSTGAYITEYQAGTITQLSGSSTIDQLAFIYDSNSKPAGAAFMRFGALLNRDAGLTPIADHGCDVYALYPTDVTHSIASADSAAASLVSQNAAAASAGSASTFQGQAATSASTASTAAGTATTQAGIATTAASTATTQASTATTNANLSASYRNQALDISGDSSFANFVEGWTTTPSGASGTGATMPSSNFLHDTSGFGRPHILRLNPNVGAQFYSKKAYPVPDLNRKYKISADVGVYTFSGTPGPAQFYIGFVGLDSVGNVVDHGGYGTYRYALIVGSTIGTDGLWHYETIVTGSGNDSWTKFPPGTAQVRLLAFMNYNNSGRHTYLDDFTWEDVTALKDSEAQATIATNQAVISTAQAAAASQSAVLSASINTGSLNANPNFINYASTYPDAWGLWAIGSASITKVANPHGGNAVRMAMAASDINVGLVSAAGNVANNNRIVPGSKQVIEAEFKLVSGSLLGAGLLLYYYDAGNNYIGGTLLPFESSKDSTGVIPGAGVAGRTYQFSKISTAPANAVTIQPYIMAGWTSFNATPATKTMDWYRGAVRAATLEEIATSEVLPAVQASVTTNSGAIATINGAAAFFQQIVAASGSNPAKFQLLAGAGGSKMGLVADSISLGNSVDGIIQDVITVENGVAKINDALIRRLKVYPRSNSDIALPVQLAPLRLFGADGAVVQYQNGDSFGAVPSKIERDISGLPALAAGESYDIQATAITATQFTVRAKKLTSPVLTNRTCAAGTNVGGTPQWRAEKVVAADAYDNNYEFQFTATIPRTTYVVDSEGGGPTYYTAEWTGTVDIYATNSAAGNAWVKVGSVPLSASYFGTSAPGTTKTITSTSILTINQAIGLHGSQELGVHPTGTTTVSAFTHVKYVSQSNGGETAITTNIPWSIYAPVSD